MLAFALQQVKTKYRSGVTQAQDIYRTWICLTSENTGSRWYLPPKAVWNARMSLLVLRCQFTSSFVFTWVIAIVCACACVASETVIRLNSMLFSVILCMRFICWDLHRSCRSDDSNFKPHGRRYYFQSRALLLIRNAKKNNVVCHNKPARIDQQCASYM